ncbi:MAG: helix-turn-helix domain-containing protein [Actinobacteria bacterium]|nr:helix-turn-helix domain-containing protein [Actinomycetota bacterium]
MTVMEVAKRLHKNPETIRRWIREGKLPAQKIGSQHFIEEGDVAAREIDDDATLPTRFTRTFWGGPMPDWAAAVRESRRGH